MKRISNPTNFTKRVFVNDSNKKNIYQFLIPVKQESAQWVVTKKCCQGKWSNIVKVIFVNYKDSYLKFRHRINACSSVCKL